MQRFITASAIPAVALAPWVAFAAPHNFQELAAFVVSFLNSATGVLIVAGLAVYFYGISTNILKFSEDRAHFRQLVVWGVLVLFIMVSIWGILQLLQSTIFGGGVNTSGGSVPAQSSSNTFVSPPFPQE